MGTFKVKFRVWNPAKPELIEELEGFVDTGAAFSWVSRERLERLGLKPSRRMPFRTIEGLGMAADPVQKKLVPTIMLALNALVFVEHARPNGPRRPFPHAL